MNNLEGVTLTDIVAFTLDSVTGTQLLTGVNITSIGL